MITSITTSLWRRHGLPLRLLLNWNCLFAPRHQSFHSSSVFGKRRGAVSDPRLPELLIDKPPTYYATLQQKLERINYYDNTVNEVDIGYGKDSQYVVNFFKTSADISENLRFADEGEDDELLLDLEDKISSATLSTEEYHKLCSLHSFTKEHIESTLALAHHLAIYRDLFYQVPVSLQTDKQLIETNARNESKYDVRSQPPTFSFLPLVPIDAEFHLESGEDVLCQKSYRGNLIPPEYGAIPPTVTINTAAINGQSKLDDLSCLSENNSPVFLNAGKSKDQGFYTLALVNLDSHFSDSGVCHWMLSNIHANSATETTAETVVKYLPVYGIRGLGYHRFAFVLFKHNKAITGLDKIDDFDLAKRKFNGLTFMDTLTEKDNDLELKPVGLSWFQTTWNESCRDVFYNYLDMRSPTYEYNYPVQTTEFKQLQFPGRAPFNLYLDHFRDSKEIAKEVLLERLKSISPLESYDTAKMYSGWNGKPKLPHIHPIPKDTPDWYKSTLLKKRALTGRWRGLRPASVILPYNNNADLDNPSWPRISPDKLPLNCPNPYPDGTRRPKPLRETLWSKPLPEHHSIRIDFAENLAGKDKDGLENKKPVRSKNQ